jgi:protein phosphatase
MTFDIGSMTHVGRRRPGNEDSLDVLPLRDGTLCVVADGMGGHQAGEVASRLAVDTVGQLFPRDAARSGEALSQTIQAANRAIFEASQADPGKQGMGTTIVCAVLHQGQAQLANVGDSPGFLIRGGQVHRLTRDHSWVAEEVARGAIQPEAAASHPYRHILTRCLGVQADLEVEVYEPVPLEPGDVIVLCSDGLSEHVEPPELAPIVAATAAQAAAEALVDLANQRGGSDNITVIVARWAGPREATVRHDTTTELFG